MLGLCYWHVFINLLEGQTRSALPVRCFQKISRVISQNLPIFLYKSAVISFLSIMSKSVRKVMKFPDGFVQVPTLKLPPFLPWSSRTPLHRLGAQPWPSPFPSNREKRWKFSAFVMIHIYIYIEYFNILYKLYMLYKLEIFVYIYINMLNCYIYTVFGDATWYYSTF